MVVLAGPQKRKIMETGGTQVCALATTQDGDRYVREAPLLENQMKPLEKSGDGKGHNVY